NQVIDLAGRAAIGKARQESLPLPAVKRDLSPRLERSAPRLDIDDARRAIAVFGGERAGDESAPTRETTVETLREAADRLRNDDAIDPVLQIPVVAAPMQLAEGVLRDARRLQ